ncbi:hypothetical protein H9P43_006530 [Blastocladiella emersonii ATCC 22665]|nr:hypothetical protein H9P43_006530 [Blastocladiella emersonii ATCC 22665]
MFHFSSPASDTKQQQGGLAVPAADTQTAPQPEPTTVTERLESLYKLIDGIHVCMLTTRRPDGRLVSRAMKVQQRLRGVDLCMITSADTHKIEELRADPHVSAAFYRDRTGEWVSVSGLATVRTLADPTGTGAAANPDDVADFKRLIDEAWTSDCAPWFPGMDAAKDPVTDPRVAVLTVRALSASYAHLDSSSPRVLFDLAVSAVSGAAVPSARIEVRNLATPDMRAARAMESTSAADAEHLRDLEHAKDAAEALKYPKSSTTVPITASLANASIAKQVAAEQEGRPALVKTSEE